MCECVACVYVCACVYVYVCVCVRVCVCVSLSLHARVCALSQPTFSNTGGWSPEAHCLSALFIFSTGEAVGGEVFGLAPSVADLESYRVGGEERE